jgi:predicted phage terminase large subunit-like protein
MADALQAALRGALRQDLASFTAKVFHRAAPAQEFSRNWHQLAIAWHLELCRQGKIRRLIITLPPRHLKSLTASVAFPAFILGHDPTARIVCVSYSADLSAKHARDCRSVMTSQWYRQLFPGTVLSRERNAELEFMTSKRGYRLSTSVGGSLTGRGGNYIIVDDPVKPDEALSDLRRAGVNEWMDNTLYSRLDDKQSDVIILIMQRLHLEDPVGHVLAKEEGWVHLNLPAVAEFDQDVPIGPGQVYHRKVGELLHPGREPQSVLDDLKRSIGTYNFAAQYQQQPIPPEGEIIKWQWFQTYDAAPMGSGYVVQSWDTASKAGELNDYSVCTTWLVAGQQFYLLDVFRQRLLYPELRRAVITQAQHYRPRCVLIEDKASGTALAQDFRRGELGAAGVPIRIEPEADKITRASVESIAIETGTVFLPSNAAWLQALHDEIVQFPSGRFDDQIDSISQFLGWVRQRQPSGIRLVKISGI